MGGRDELRAAVRAVMAEKRERLGSPPTPEELLDYRDGRLEGAERDEVEAKIDAFPEAARALADLAAFPNLDKADDDVPISDEELSVRWQSFLERAEADESSGEVLDFEARPTPTPGRPTPTPGRWANRSRWLAAATMIFALGLASGLVIDHVGFRPESPAAAVNVTIHEVAPDGTAGQRAGARTVIELPAVAEAWVLVAGLDDAGDAVLSADLVDEAGTVVWTAAGLRWSPAGTVQLAFRSDALDAGIYRLRIFRLEGKQRREAATYSFRLVKE